MAEVDVLNVTLHGERVGTIIRLPPDRIQFLFDEAYVANDERSTLSLSFKDVYGDLITDIKPTHVRVPPFFANLLPEGHLREYLAMRAGVNPRREFFLLWALGGDLPGAVRVDAAEPGAWPDRRDIEDSREPRPADTPFRFSLAGVQLKFSAVQSANGGLTIPVDGAGGSWIAKLPSATYSSVPENEYSMMMLASRIGIDVPEIQLLPTEAVTGLPRGVESVGPNIFAIKRFDRTKPGRRVHIEDFAQIFGRYPDQKYGHASYRNIAEVVAAETSSDDVVELVRRLVFNILIGNADMHLKNWSVIYPDDRHAALAPAYDFVSTIPYLPDDTLALSLVGTKSFAETDVARFRRFADKSRLPKALVVDTLETTVRSFREAWSSSEDLPLEAKARRAIEDHLTRLPIWDL